MEEQVRDILKINSGLGDVAQQAAATDNLWEMGMNSLASVRVLVALEEAFGLEFPDDKLSMQVFASIESIVKTVSELRDGEGR